MPEGDATPAPFSAIALVMCEPANTPRTAKELAQRLAEPLEAIADVYLLMGREDYFLRQQQSKDSDREALTKAYQIVLDAISLPE